MLVWNINSIRSLQWDLKQVMQTYFFIQADGLGQNVSTPILEQIQRTLSPLYHTFCINSLSLGLIHDLHVTQKPLYDMFSFNVQRWSLKSNKKLLKPLAKLLIKSFIGLFSFKCVNVSHNLQWNPFEHNSHKKMRLKWREHNLSI